MLAAKLLPAAAVAPNPAKPPVDPNGESTVVDVDAAGKDGVPKALVVLVPKGEAEKALGAPKAEAVLGVPKAEAVPNAEGALEVAKAEAIPELKGEAELVLDPKILGLSPLPLLNPPKPPVLPVVELVAAPNPANPPVPLAPVVEVAKVLEPNALEPKEGVLLAGELNPLPEVPKAGAPNGDEEPNAGAPKADVVGAPNGDADPKAEDEDEGAPKAEVDGAPKVEAEGAPKAET